MGLQRNERVAQLRERFWEAKKRLKAGTRPNAGVEPVVRVEPAKYALEVFCGSGRLGLEMSKAGLK
eukprot:11201956-Karenia_brevis.AAC.1